MSPDLEAQETPDPVSGVPVLLAGIATTAATLVGIYFLNQTGFYLMGFLLWYVVPVGAIAVGALSGSGYCFAQWKLNLRVSKGTLWLILLVSLLAYGTAHYISYLSLRAALPPEEAAGVTFLDYLRWICENVTVKSTDSGSKAVELGRLGYAVVLLELVGFCLGAMIPSFLLRFKPYCAKCRKYFRGHASYLVDATPDEGFRKLKRPEKQARLDEVAQRAGEIGRKLAEGLAGAGRADVLTLLEKARIPKLKGALATVKVELALCPDCDAYHAEVNLATQSADGQGSFVKLATIDGPGGVAAPAGTAEPVAPVDAGQA